MATTQKNMTENQMTRQQIMAAKTCLWIVALLMTLMLASCAGNNAPLTQQTANYTVKLSFDTLAVGDRTATIDLTDQAGQPVDARQVTLAPTMLSMGMASPEVNTRAMGNGRYSGENVLLSMTGDWEVDVRIQSDQGAETARFLLTVPTQ